MFNVQLISLDLFFFFFLIQKVTIIAKSTLKPLEMAIITPEQTCLETWLLRDSTKCTVSGKIGVQETNYGGRGIFALENLGNHQPIIKIAPSYLLNFTTIIRHITIWNHELVLPESYKHIHIEYEAENGDEVTDFYASLTLEELLKLSSFQLVTLYLVLEQQRGDRSWWKPFLNMLPPQTDFLTSPLVWLNDDDMNNFSKLPKTTQLHAQRMFTRLNTDFKTVEKLLKSHTCKISISEDEFFHAWMCVNSRCLYMEIPEGKNKDDNLTMAPFVDFINHSPLDQCVLKIDRSGFYVITGSRYAQGDELFLSYGPHSNEFLLCEYGFTLANNEWNDVDITDEVLKLMNEDQVNFLKEKDYYGEYTISKDCASFRTEVALAVSQERQELFGNRKLNALLNGVSDGDVYKERSNLILRVILKKLKKEFESYLELQFEEDFKSKAIGKLYKEKVDIIDHTLEQLEKQLNK